MSIDYSKHSHFTDPGPYKTIYNDISDDIVEIIEFVQTTILSPVDIKIINSSIDIEKEPRPENRSVKKILEPLFSQLGSKKNVNEGINLNNTYVTGNCRDMSLLLCSIMREKNIPSRLRVGFSTYTHPFFYHDKIVVEYWDKSTGEPKIIDIVLTPTSRNSRKLNFGPTSVPKKGFIYSGDAWNRCRTKNADPKKFGCIIKNIEFTGRWYIRNTVFHDFALLHKVEYDFDIWWSDYMLKYINDDKSLEQDFDCLEVIDKIALLTL